MRVLVTGAYGLIGSACLARLHRDGHELVAAGRNVGQARQRAPYARWVEADYDRLTQADDWLPLLAGIDAVVNCVGVLQDGARDDVRRVQVDATTALFTACERAGVRRVVHISAIGASHTAPTAFARTKAEADDDLARRNLDWAVLRPALVLAPVVYGGTAMLRGLAGLPFVLPVIEADARIQVIGADDVAAAVAHCLIAAKLNVRWDVAHPQVHTLRSLVGATRDWLGFPRRPILAMPRSFGTAVSAFADGLGFLGWRSPARTTALRQLSAGVVGDPAPWIAATGIAPKSLEDILALHPSSVSDRWFARLFWVKPIAIAGLASFWSLTGIISLGPGREMAMAHLAAAGFSPGFAVAALVLGAWFDVILGLALLVRPIARGVLLTMLFGSFFYLAVGTALAPQLWADPLGPFLKVIPLLVAVLFTLAILDER